MPDKGRESKVQFFKWLSLRMPAALVLQLNPCYNEIEKRYNRSKKANTSLFSDLTMAKAAQIKNMIERDRVFCFLHRSQMKTISSALQLLYDYAFDLNSIILDGVPEKTAPPDFANKKPIPKSENATGEREEKPTRISKQQDGQHGDDSLRENEDARQEHVAEVAQNQVITQAPEAEAQQIDGKTEEARALTVPVEQGLPSLPDSDDLYSQQLIQQLLLLLEQRRQQQLQSLINLLSFKQREVTAQIVKMIALLRMRSMLLCQQQKKPSIEGNSMYLLNTELGCFKGETPAEAFLRFCNRLRIRYPNEFRDLSSGRASQHIDIFLPANHEKDEDRLELIKNSVYINKDLSDSTVRFYCSELLRKCVHASAGNVNRMHRASAQEQPKKTGESARSEMEPELLAIMSEPEFFSLREKLCEQRITKLEQFRALQLWPFLLENNLFATEDRQKAYIILCSRLKKLKKADEKEARPLTGSDNGEHITAAKTSDAEEKQRESAGASVVAAAAGVALHCTDKATAPEENAAVSEPDASEVDVLLCEERFAPLRELLSQYGIRSLDGLKAIKLWPFMNSHDLYSIGMRQTILEEVNALLYPKAELDASKLFALRVGDDMYEGSSPSEAFLRFCDSYSTRFPLQFRLLIGAKMRDSITVPLRKSMDAEHRLKLTNVMAYIREDLSKVDVVRYAGWICGKCGEALVEIFASEPALQDKAERTVEAVIADQQAGDQTSSDQLDHADQTESIASSETLEPEKESGPSPATEEDPVQEQIQLPEPVSQPQPANARKVETFIDMVEREVLKADMDGTSYEAVKKHFGLTMVATRRVIEAAPRIVDINGRLIHEEAFIDWDDGADQLEELLNKLMQKNDGYVSSAQLYEYAKTEMTMFLNDNDLNEERAVYDMAQHLFVKVKYHGKQYKFTGKAHISNLEDGISSNLDVYKKYAADQGGLFSIAALVEYLDRVGLSTGNLRMQMRVYSEPIFFCYDEGIYMYAGFMGIDDEWKATVKKALQALLTEAGGHAILRQLPEAWLAQLPLLPQSSPWTPLLLQSVLRWYGEELGARTVPAMEGQAGDTLHTMLVTMDSPIQSFGDVVITWLIDTESEQRDFEAEELRKGLVEAGIIQGNELIWNMPKALKQDERFAWDATGSSVKIEVR